MGSNKSKASSHRSDNPAGFGKWNSPGFSGARAETVNPSLKRDLANFAVITVVFNPIQYQSRYDHYHKFQTHMSQSGVQLITVECIFDSAPRFGLPRQNFTVTRAGNRQHIQLNAPSIIWMKENLINVAINSLPANIEYIAWLDADIEFERLDWPSLTIEELQRYPIVQLFELSFFLGPGGKKDILRRDYSFGYSVRHNKPIGPGRSNDWYAHPGYAWAMRRSAFNAIGGLIDFCIIGSGDLHFAFALLHRIEETLRPSLHQDYRQLAIDWGNQVAQVAQNGVNVGYLPINLWHHWHGERKDRNYVDRWTILEKHQFSPLNDLEKNDDNGLIRLIDSRHLRHSAEAKRIEALENDIVNYFKSRNEDSQGKSVPTPHPGSTRMKPYVAPKKQTYRGGGIAGFKSSTGRPGGGVGYPLWTSGPSGTHVDDDCPVWDQCTCPGHHHHHGNHDCPCSPDHSDHRPHHHDTNDWSGEHHSSHHHHQPGDWENTDPIVHHHGHHHHDHSSGGEYDHHSGHHHHDYSSGGGYDHHSGHHHDYSSAGAGYDYSSSGGGYGTNDYGSPGSFY